MSSRQINYNGRKFMAVANSESGEVSGDTVFTYHQEGDLFWAEYSGGEVLKGFMVGLAAPDGKLEFNYQHLNKGKQIRLGKCRSTPEVLPEGLLRMHEVWQWLDGSQEHGTSTLIEVK